MAHSEEERYSLEDILLEFKQPEKETTPTQTAPKAPPAAEHVPKRLATAPAKMPQPTLSDEEMQAQEDALAARMEASRLKREAHKPKPAVHEVEDTIVATIAQVKRENDAIPVEQRTADHGQITMKFPAVKEMVKQAEQAPKKPEEPKPEPLNFAAFTKREVPPRKAPPPPTEEDKLKNRTSAPWRTAAEPGKNQPKAPEEKAPPRMRTIDLTAGQTKLEFTPDIEAFDPE